MSSVETAWRQVFLSGVEELLDVRCTQRHRQSSACAACCVGVRRGVANRARSQPRSWSNRNVKHGWRRVSIDPRSRAPKGVLSFWTRARRLLWSWWPWALMSVWGVAEGRWGWAIGAGAMAMVSYLIAPAALPPRFGRDHEFSIESNEFPVYIAGDSGGPCV